MHGYVTMGRRCGRSRQGRRAQAHMLLTEAMVRVEAKGEEAASYAKSLRMTLMEVMVKMAAQ